jgi:DNA-binding XRE family transcriptional regulator
MNVKLKLLIKEKEMKQGDIADKIGVSKGALSLIVNGKSMPTLTVAIKLARVLETSVEYLWGDLVE